MTDTTLAEGMHAEGAKYQLPVLDSRTEARGTDRRRNAHDNQQGTKQEHSGSASVLEVVTHD